MAHERLSEVGWDRLRAGLAAGDPNDEVGAAYLAKELLRDVYATRSVRAARRALHEFYDRCIAAEVPELTRLARTFGSWEREILGWHRTGLSNGATEATNLLIKKIKRVGTASATSTTIDSVFFSTAVLNGRLAAPHESEAVNHSSSRRPVCTSG